MNSQPKKIKLALQGGGSHGAFAWGVLDRLPVPKTSLVAFRKRWIGLEIGAR